MITSNTAELLKIFIDKDNRGMEIGTLLLLCSYIIKCFIKKLLINYFYHMNNLFHLKIYKDHFQSSLPYSF